MKDVILNTATLLMVAAALVLTALREGTARQKTEMLTPAPAPLAAEAPIPAYRVRREKERAEEMAALLELSEMGEGEISDQAALCLLALQRQTEAELAAEALLIGRGYGDALCIAEGETLLVVMAAPLPGEAAAEMLLWLQEVSGFSAENIHITC